MNSYFTLVASKEDPASNVMAEYLINQVGFSISKKNYAANRSSLNRENDFSEYRYQNITLHVSHNNSLLYLEELDERYPGSEAFIFLSRHSSESGIPTLTCHFTGNFSASSPYGGNPRELGICFPSLQKSYIKEINMVRSQVPDFEITIEATHHGPTSLKKPSLFIEIGSTPKQWVDKHAASTVFAARQQDGHRRRRLAVQPGHPDLMGPRLHQRPLRHAVRRSPRPWPRPDRAQGCPSRGLAFRAATLATVARGRRGYDYSASGPCRQTA